MLKLKFAFHKIERPDGKILPFLKAPEVPHVPYELKEFGLEKYFRQLHSFLEECAKATNAMLMKIDRLQYAAYSQEGPYIQWTMDGRPHVHCRDDYTSLTQEDYEKWRVFVIDYAFKAVEASILYPRQSHWDGAPREYFIRESE